MMPDALVSSQTAETLARQISTEIGLPRDAWQLTAQLEVSGMRDVDARTRFGERDLFSLGRLVFDWIYHSAREAPRAAVLPAGGFAVFIRRYLRGSIFALPMLLQSAAMLAWGFGLWGAVDIDVRTGTAIALGFVASYVATSGFVQAIVRAGLFYHYQNEESLTRWVVLRGCGIAAVSLLAFAALAFLFNVGYGLLPWDLFLTALLYFAALSFVWLSWSMVYIAGRRYWIPLVTVAGLAIVAIGVKVLHWPVIAANAIGIVAAGVISFFAGLAILPPRNGGVHNPPRLTVLVYSGSRFFLYGLLYSSFLFADRLIAWSSRAAREDFPPYTFWLNTRYELGMDFALLVVVFLSGFIEAAIDRTSESFVAAQKNSGANAAEDFIAWFRRFYARRLLTLTIAGVASVALARLGLALARLLPNHDLRTSLYSSSATFTFWVGAAGYVALMLALQNVLLLLTLTRVDLVLRSLSIALVVNLTTGFAISRAVHYAGSAVGLLAGAIVLFALTLRDTRKVASELDYYFYAAY